MKRIKATVLCLALFMGLFTNCTLVSQAKISKQEVYKKYIAAMEKGSIKVKEYDRGYGLIDINGDGIEELFCDHKVWTIKSGKVKKLFNFPKEKGVWWEYNKSRKLLINSNTSGWEGGYVWKIKGNKTKFLYGYVQNHDEKRTMFLYKNGKKKKISIKTYNKYEKKTNKGKSVYLETIYSKEKTIKELKVKAGLLEGKIPVSSDSIVYFVSPCKNVRSVEYDGLKINANLEDGETYYKRSYGNLDWQNEEKIETGIQYIELDATDDIIFTYESEKTPDDMYENQITYEDLVEYLEEAIDDNEDIGISIYVQNGKAFRVGIIMPD